MIYIGIILTIIAIAVLLVAFFLFAIWRAILGKSSVDLKLATSVDIQTKRIENLSKNFNSYDANLKNLTHEAKEMSKYLKDIIAKK